MGYTEIRVWKNEMKKAPLPETSELMQTDCEQELTMQPGANNFYLFYVLLSRRFYKPVYFDLDFVANLEYLVSPNQSAKSTDLKMVFFLSFNDF